MANIEVGTVSHGTLRTQDLIPAFLRELRRVNPDAYQQLATPAAGFPIVPAYAEEDDASEWWASEAAGYVLDMLTDELAMCAPRGLYFGAHWGDGSDFGWWPEENADEEPPTFTGNEG